MLQTKSSAQKNTPSAVHGKRRVPLVLSSKSTPKSKILKRSPSTAAYYTKAARSTLGTKRKAAYMPPPTTKVNLADKGLTETPTAAVALIAPAVVSPVEIVAQGTEMSPKVAEPTGVAESLTQMDAPCDKEEVEKCASEPSLKKQKADDENVIPVRRSYDSSDSEEDDREEMNSEPEVSNTPPLAQESRYDNDKPQKAEAEAEAEAEEEEAEEEEEEEEEKKTEEIQVCESSSSEDEDDLDDHITQLGNENKRTTKQGGLRLKDTPGADSQEAVMARLEKSITSAFMDDNYKWEPECAIRIAQKNQRSLQAMGRRVITALSFWYRNQHALNRPGKWEKMIGSSAHAAMIQAVLYNMDKTMSVTISDSVSKPPENRIEVDAAVLQEQGFRRYFRIEAWIAGGANTATRTVYLRLALL
jgi:hypothetical protein